MNKAIIHIINFLVGLVAVGSSLFFAWGVLAFGPNGNLLYVALPLAVSVIWGAIYYLQLKFQSISSFLLLLMTELILFYLLSFTINLS
ncbi:hypothetical protein [Evansella cellulosilytica]|uniref:Uncharacterized protein n=1 Tax=Evansella cellulosilytica (strain ATCC 21833 / DSM 2522 / FERM P-1141 / JCM 9156 / N-4) TaxID=649639 RepID=E6TYE7_EVAC2|nr:hypothetical protein [Evansella cellulosilytica]ADU28885.1 hypothetical protein Bcell_0603 [Evansella cellulosilytica DSM 2522]